MSDDLQRSPLHPLHLEMGAKLIPFAGWEMPVQYAGIVPEHQAVRQAVGVFDISHMGQFLVSGRDAAAFLNQALTNDVSLLDVGQGQYTLLLNEAGGVIDDLILYRTSDREFFLVVNASKIAEDWQQFQKLLNDELDVQMANASSLTGGIAVQGPKSEAVFRALMGPDAPYPAHNTVFIAASEEHGIMWLCGTGYTGEDGFELFTPSSHIDHWFRAAVDAAKAEGGSACGLGARDTLRLEMGYPLNGNDLSPLRSPLQAGLGIFVKLDKPDFIGREMLTKQKVEGLPDKLCGFRLVGSAPPPRPHYGIQWKGQTVSEVASGSLSPSLGYGIGMAYLPLEASAPGTPLEIEIRGKMYPAEVTKKPFYRRTS
jgi:aminomethyltransferase